MMMKKNLYLLFWGLIALTSCSLNDPLAYENDPAIYFANKDINYSFFYAESASSKADVFITVHAMGNPSPSDRSFSLVQSNVSDANAAVSGTHFLPLSSQDVQKRMVMPAGQSEVKVPITLLKDPSLDLKTVKLTLKVAANDHFKVGVLECDTTNIMFSSLAIKPTNWSDWYNAFGDSWGSVKMRFIIDNTGITNFDTIPSDSSFLYFLNSKIQQKLFEYNNLHPDAPLAEADGTLVNFDNPYIW
jgi:hypothetical protein